MHDRLWPRLVNPNAGWHIASRLDDDDGSIFLDTIAVLSFPYSSKCTSETYLDAHSGYALVYRRPCGSNVTGGQDGEKLQNQEKGTSE